MKLEWKTEQRTPNQLLPLEINPRKISEEKRGKLIDSLKKFNLAEIPTINADNKIISGHQRITGLQLMGRGEELIDVRVPNRMLTEKEVKEYNLISNTHAGEFDHEMLDEFFNDLDFEALGVSIPEAVIDEDEVVNVEPAEDPDEFEVPNEIETDIVLGDLFQIGNHRLLCGDSTNSDDVAKLMGGELADIVHTDPPYNIDYGGGTKKREKIANDKLDNFNQFLYDVYVNLNINVKAGGAIYVWHASTETHNFISEFIKAGFLFKSYIVWNKDNSTFGRSDYHRKHEPAIYGWKEGAAHKWCGDRKQVTVWDVKRPMRSDEHPTMKPIELCYIPLNNSSEKGDLVLDVFLGSGSTMVASHILNRKCYGMELDPKYCQVIIDRMKKTFPGIEVKKLN